MSEWAAKNLGHYPGRCRVCGWHIATQGHDGNMDHSEPDPAHEQDRQLLLDTLGMDTQDGVLQ